MPDVNEDAAKTDAIVKIFQQYYQIASNSISSRTSLIKDDSIRTSVLQLADRPAPTVALYICKLIMVLSDQRKHARLLAEAGYIPILARYTEQEHLPVKLLTKFLQLQNRLINAQKDSSSEAKPEPRRRTKELVFILPVLTELQQASISQNTLQKIKGMVSLSFKLNEDSSKSHCVIRCLLHVEPKQISDQILKSGFEECGYLHTNENGTKEVFTFYKDTETPAEIDDGFPQYLDENIVAFDPKTALATSDCKQGPGWLSSAKQLFGFW
ncbi:unnamed protein product [Bursaphelenchus xylophilus]|uniref:(pine wood nematode) hypothetical protein n=1 Tax=Bursaphelenchus xylophilus TaxID=6326 RepID=A0A1I7RVZ7_BURXY|nr:unnamed protein product [Bursaphelenchus xylophilus]CAG9094925.1 unnamed protein product [Bursaphelenchus xylophilus]